jgi:predicted ATP-grasp superfamily ATP-dependent carboligase
LPLVADAFGDLDTRDAAQAWRVIEGAVQTGFTTRPLVAALNALAEAAPTPPIGLVLGSGFEDKPQLITALAKRYRLIGAGAMTVKAVNEPASLFPALARLSIAHPETRRDPPAQGTGWLSKRIGGSGGRHIRVARGGQRPRPRRYYQRQIDGARLSVGAVFAADGPELALSRQWIAPSPEHPFRYGGAVSMPDVAPNLRSALFAAARRAGEHFALAGLASFDFIVADGAPHLVDINPRPGASLDVLDDDEGSLFRAHVAACEGPRIPPVGQGVGPARAAAILHADRGAVKLGDIPWPVWSADRGAPGTHVPEGAPLATARAEAPTADAAERLARDRLAELQDLIYGHETTREPH